ncbi:squalene/phytoene synthase family protein [Fertoebacter nigrum]|uniref:Squalene/phytoene synthase family protein n=1 Tax=Fertoeibacter niger TaxID=2656921 RepID=A0A8X8KPP9_9RHOB|nr:squalene/phytoene synthase family protein [Fertoeibacter niger]NUB43222.1 squalene/phytoene synthase family protein [Fertoeibacter niger]
MSLAACAAMVERGDPDRFAATMAAPPTARAVLFPLYAFNLEVARAPWMTQEAMIAEMRLQFWRDAVAEAAEGRVRAHEVVTPLAQVIRDHALPVAVLDAIVAARRWDIYRDAFADRAAFDAHLADTAGGLMWLAALALGAPAVAEPAVRDAGWAMGLANWLRAVPELEARGRIPLVDGRAEAVAALAGDGLARLWRAMPALRRLPGSAMPALWAGWQTSGLLALAQREPGRVAAGALHLTEFQKRGGLLWRAFTGRP